ncbi:UNKNOWN [Stylonychia lemnae]|uniref:60S ribosomal protein L39 n=1 Tax=Stylonychia lemnae TaxID=5949 RepID=A0A078AJ23_STYLE|nr:UNKNOWN [Stylonychia lemnae]|eukprot:CDW82224.1 UNKNOWN [Stylonychia lemnae]
MGMIFSEFQCFGLVQLWSDQCSPLKNDIEKFYQVQCKSEKLENQNGLDQGAIIGQQNKKLSANSSDNTHLGISKNLSSGIMRQLSIIKIRLSNDGWGYLSQGLGKAQALYKLQVNLCNLSHQAIEMLQPGLKMNQSLEVIDFSCNGITDDCGGLLAKIVQEQSEMRDQVVWLHGLRGEKPKNLEEIGLKEFHLCYNKLGSNFIKALAKVVKYDEYLRVIDLKFNKITDNVVKSDLIPALKNNNSLTNLDLRNNNCNSYKHQQIIALCLLKNIDKLKKSKIIVKKQWLNPSVLLFEPGDLIEQNFGETGQFRQVQTPINQQSAKISQGFDMMSQMGSQFSKTASQKFIQGSIKQVQAPIMKKNKRPQSRNNIKIEDGDAEFQNQMVIQGPFAQTLQNQFPISLNIKDGTTFKRSASFSDFSANFVKDGSREDFSIVAPKNDQNDYDKSEFEILNPLSQVQHPDQQFKRDSIRMKYEVNKLNDTINRMKMLYQISQTTQPLNNAAQMSNTEFNNVESQNQKYQPGTGGDGSEEVLSRIDMLMGELTRLMDSLENTSQNFNFNFNNNQTFQNIMQRLNDTTQMLNRTPASPNQGSIKTFRKKVRLAKKIKQNRPMPNWIRYKTDNKIRYNAKRRNWRRTKLKF